VVDAAGPLAGELSALAAALCWAVAVALFRAPIAEHGARAVNLAKNAIACLLLALTMLALGEGGALAGASARSLAWVAFSGVLGLTLGDTALFSAVARLGPPRALLLQSFTPVFTALIAYLALGARIGGWQLIGGAVILAGVVLVVAAGLGTSPGRGTIGHAGVGWGLGVLAAFGQAAGIVLAKQAMVTLPIVSASFVRMGTGALGLALVLALSGRLRTTGHALVSPASLRRLVPASMLGTYIAFLLMMASVAWAPAAVAAVMLATVPMWSLLLDAGIHHRRVRPAELAGTLVAVAGVALVTLSP